MTTADLTNVQITTRIAKLSPLVYARISGFLYLLLAGLAAFSMIYLPSVLIVPGDVATTLSNLTASEGLFRLGIVGVLATQTVQIGLVLVLYKLLKPVSKNQAVLMVTFILLGVPIAMLNELNYLAALLLNGSALALDQGPALIPFFLELHTHGVMIGHIFAGLWLFPMGYLVFKSGFLPKLIGVLLIVGGFGYLADFVTFFLFPGSGVTVSQYTFIGELLLPLWLLLRGVNVEQWEKRALEAAQS